jgi:hypothetical protein
MRLPKRSLVTREPRVNAWEVATEHERQAALEHERQREAVEAALLADYRDGTLTHDELLKRVAGD